MRRKYSAEELTGQAFMLDKINREGIEKANKKMIKKIINQNKDGIVGYIRISCKEKSEILIRNQEKSILDFCKEYNIKCKKFFIDEGYSGINFDRPGIKNITENVKYKIILVKDFSRFSREYISIKRYVDKNKKIIISVICPAIIR